MRSGLIGMLSATPRVVLDVACRSGRNGALVRERFSACHVIGIESDPARAAQARTRLHQVFTGTVVDIDLTAAGVARGSIDAVLCVDVLAQLVDPWRALSQLHEFLAPSGEVILSVPNVRNLLTMSGLIGGTWTYEQQGVPDVHQLRFFTRRDVAVMARQCGYVVVHEEFVFDPRLQPIFDAATTFPTEVNGDRFALKDIDREELAELCANTLYFRLRKTDMPRSS